MQQDDESNPALIGTIKVPRNLGLITDRLPASQYDGKEKRLSRNASLPVIDERTRETSPINQQPVDLRKVRGGSLAPIIEREELKSARDRKSKHEEILKHQPVSSRLGAY
jgi:hypothetical protein